jgi:hypothetical protein
MRHKATEITENTKNLCDLCVLCGTRPCYNR